MSIASTLYEAFGDLCRGLAYGVRLAVHASVIFGMAVGLHMIQLVGALVLAPQPVLRGRFMSWIAGSLWSVMNRIHYSCGLQVTYSGDLEGQNEATPVENALIVVNHLCDLDWVITNDFGRRHGMLGHCRYFIKKSLLYVPFFGLGMKLVGFPMLSRSWTDDERTISQIFANLRSTKLPCWMFSFVEGTRMTPSKLAEAQEFCMSRNLPIFQNVLYPRTKGFIATVQALQGTHISHIYDMTIAYQHIPTGQVNKVFPSILAAHAEDMKSMWRVHVDVKRTMLSELGTSEKEIGVWIRQAWADKDARLAQWKHQWPAHSHID